MSQFDRVRMTYYSLFEYGDLFDESCKFFVLHLHLALVLVVALVEFHRGLCIRKLESVGYYALLFA